MDLLLGWINFKGQTKLNLSQSRIHYICFECQLVLNNVLSFDMNNSFRNRAYNCCELYLGGGASYSARYDLSSRSFSPSIFTGYGVNGHRSSSAAHYGKFWKKSVAKMCLILILVASMMTDVEFNSEVGKIQ